MFLAEFDFILEYKCKKLNVDVVDALSCKAQFVTMSVMKTEIHEMIREGLQHDPKAVLLGRRWSTIHHW